MLNYTSPIKENKNYADLVIKEIGPVMKLNLRGKKREFLSTVGKTLNMIFQIPKILLGIKKEHNTIEQIIEDYKIDGVISDNRFGLSTKKVPCVFITHQLQIQSPFFTDVIQKFNYQYINKYNDESKIIDMIIAIMKTSFCFLENDQVLNPYSVTL